MADEGVQSIACPLCGEVCRLADSKRGKPYAICLACGMQLFARGARAGDLMRALAVPGAALGKSKSVLNNLSVLEELEARKSNLFPTDPDYQFKLRALERGIRQARAALEG